jgi:hypothetical protein
MTSLPPVPPETVSAWMQLQVCVANGPRPNQRGVDAARAGAFTSDVQTPRLGENAKPYAMAILRFQIDGHMLLSASHEDFQVRISFLAFARASAHTVVW